MTTATGNTPSPGSTRGRGLDALFDSTAPPPGPKFNVEADLAALLDNEVLAAETGRSTDAGAPRDFGADSQPQPTAAGPSAAAGRTADSIDVPPLASEAQPAPAAAEPGRQLPTTKRFGAIIMDAVPQPAAGTEGATAEALVPAMPGERTLPSAPGATAEEERPLPVTERTEDQKTIVISRLNQVLNPNWQRAFHQQIDALYKQVATEFSSPPAAAERALTLLREARQLMIDSPEEYVNAEYRLMQVQAMVDRVKESRKQSVYYGPRILAYEAAWLLVLLLGLIFATPLTRWLTVISGVSGPALLNINPILNTMFWGGIGGVVGALYALWWHISERQNFDRNYLMWYLVQPLMGLVLGGITFLILTGGFLILQVDLSDDKASTGARLLPYLTAVLAGFRQNFVYEQLDRLISLFTPSTRRESGGEGPSV